MAAINVHTVLPRGIGPSFQPFTDSTMTVPASRSGMLVVRNRAPGEVVITISIPDSGPDSLGSRDVATSVPPSAQRIYALSFRMCDPSTGIITLALSGDTSNVDGFALERQTG